MILALAGLAAACGPDFPVYLLGAPADDLFEPPVGDFAALIAPLAPPSSLPASVGEWKEAERADAVAGLPADLVEPWMDARTAIREGRTYSTPAGLPEEYRLYLEGSAAWWRKRCDDLSAFERLLDLPPEQRRNRTTWALWNLSVCATDQPAAWERVRAAAEGGFADRWGLAASTWGEQGLYDGVTPAGFRDYLAQSAVSTSGTTSLLLYARDALDRPEKRMFYGPADPLPALAEDPVTAAILTAYVVSRDTAPPRLDEESRAAWEADPDTRRRRRWLAHLEGHRDVVNAGMAAWVAYQAGRWEEAEAWTQVAKADDGWAAWVRGRLLLRAGDVGPAEAALATAAAQVPNRAWYTDGRFRDPDQGPSNPAEDARAESGAALLAAADAEGALTRFYGTRYWLDAAYVAERVLTVDELVRWVDANAPVTPPPSETRHEDWSTPYGVRDDSYFGCAPCDPALWPDRIRWLLARRLVRAGRLDDALRYVPERYRAELEALRDDRAAGRSIAAARRMRVSGLELAGTELDPDYTVFLGEYELTYGATRMSRLDDLGPWPWERQRYEASAPSPNRRYHYRFVAAEELVGFARSLPDDDPRVAWSYCTAGRWVESRDHALAMTWYREAHRRPIDRSGVQTWWGACGDEPGPPAWWWPWRREIQALVAIGLAGAGLVWWRVRRR